MWPFYDYPDVYDVVPASITSYLCSSLTSSSASENVTSTLCGISPDSGRHWQDALIFFTVLAGIAIILRLVSKFRAASKLAWDDVFAFIAYVSIYLFLYLH